MKRDESDQEFLTAIQRLEPATVQELCAEMGVTATAVRQRLMRLQNDNLVDRGVFKQERGRPQHKYKLTRDGIRALGDDYPAIASLLWREVMKIEPVEVRQQVIQGVKHSLIERFGQENSQGNLSGKLQSLAKVMSSQGFDIEVGEITDESGALLPVLREHNCPYHELALEDTSICELEQSVYSELLGTSVELSSCQLDGHKCCEFSVGASQ